MMNSCVLVLHFGETGAPRASNTGYVTVRQDFIACVRPHPCGHVLSLSNTHQCINFDHLPTRTYEHSDVSLLHAVSLESWAEVVIDIHTGLVVQRQYVRKATNQTENLPAPTNLVKALKSMSSRSPQTTAFSPLSTGRPITPGLKNTLFVLVRTVQFLPPRRMAHYHVRKFLFFTTPCTFISPCWFSRS
jgi:hypothetical protein